MKTGESKAQIETRIQFLEQESKSFDRDGMLNTIQRNQVLLMRGVLHVIRILEKREEKDGVA